MDHAFELAFDLLAEAADRIQHQQYGITRILFHNHGPILLTTVHEYSPEQGHHLVLLANDDYGLLAAIEATAPDLDTTPDTPDTHRHPTDTLPTTYRQPTDSPPTTRRHTTDSPLTAHRQCTDNLPTALQQPTDNPPTALWQPPDNPGHCQ